MKAGTLLVLAVGAGGILAGAVWLSGARSAAVAPAQGSALVAGLLERVNDAASITITGPGAAGTRVTELRRGDDGTWALLLENTESGPRFPVRADKVRETLIALAEAQVREEKTSNPANYARLGVQDVDLNAQGAEGEPGVPFRPRSIVVRDGKGAELASVIVGMQATQVGGAERAGSGRAGTFVRRAGNPTALLVEVERGFGPGGLVVDVDPSVWLAREIANVERERIASVEIRRGENDAEAVRASRPDEKTAALTLSVPEGKQSKGEGALSPLLSLFSLLTLDEVRPAKDEMAGEVVTTVGRTFDGLIVTVRQAKIEGAWWARVEAGFEDPASGAVGGGEGEGVQARPARKSAEEVRREAEKINARAKGWEFKLPEFKGNQLATKLSELLEEPAPPAPPAPPATAGPPAPPAP
ncbi:MAG: DUF4340 domain-containing protein [Planctomycetota bacterium]|nr:DUF4340 domain-containing protein [Planctomycetota bacterium]